VTLLNLSFIVRNCWRGDLSSAAEPPGWPCGQMRAGLAETMRRCRLELTVRMSS